MEINKKKEYLDLYLLQQAKILRLKKLMEQNPDSSNRYLVKIKNAEQLREKIEEDIENVDGGLLSEVLSQHYLCGRSLEQTAYALNYSKRHIERLHKTAMEKLSIS